MYAASITPDIIVLDEELALARSAKVALLIKA
jgi:hypothetical protein